MPGEQDADRREPLLADQLLLQRLELLRACAAPRRPAARSTRARRAGCRPCPLNASRRCSSSRDGIGSSGGGAEIAGADAIRRAARGAPSDRSQRRRNSDLEREHDERRDRGDADRAPVDRPRPPPRDRRRDARRSRPIQDWESARRRSRAPRPRASNVSPGCATCRPCSSVIVTVGAFGNTVRWSEIGPERPGSRCSVS